MTSSSFVDIGKRDRKTVGTYSEADIFNDLMGPSGAQNRSRVRAGL